MSDRLAHGHLVLVFSKQGFDLAADDFIKKLKSRPAGKGTTDWVDVSNMTVAGIRDTMAACLVQEYTASSRIYLFGHADWRQQSLESWSGDRLAATFLNVPRRVRISIAACSLGRDLDTADTTLVAASCKSFASKFHLNLSNKNEVFARVFDVKILGAGSREAGAKATLVENSGFPSVAVSVAKRQASKLRFYWNGATQMREWVTYTNEVPDEFSVGRMADIMLEHI